MNNQNHMNNQNQFKSLNSIRAQNFLKEQKKKVSTLAGVLILVFIAFLVGGILISLYLRVIGEETETTEIVIKRLKSEEPKKATEISHSSLIESSFSYPYPVSWEEKNVKFSLTKVSLGKISAPFNLSKLSGGKYNTGEEVYALVLYLKINTSKMNSSQCIPLNIRRLINEEGDLLAPNTKQFYFPDSGGCIAMPNKTYFDQKIIFVVPEQEKEFHITTGGQLNMFFTITVLENNNLKVEKVYPEEIG